SAGASASAAVCVGKLVLRPVTAGGSLAVTTPGSIFVVALFGDTGASRGYNCHTVTATTNTAAPIAAGLSQDDFVPSCDRLTRVRCCVAELPPMRALPLPTLRGVDCCRLMPSGAVAISLCSASTKAAPVLKRSPGSYAINPVI